MADNLTPEELGIVEGVRDYWMANMCREVAFADVEKAVHEFYESAGLKRPKVELHDGPKAAVAAYKAEMNRRKLPIPDEKPLWCCMWWQAWAAYYDAGVKIGKAGYANNEEYKRFREWCWCVPICMALEEICYVVKFPTRMTWDEQHRLHCLNEDGTSSGPAIAFRDGFESWVIHGVDVGRQIVMEPETQTVAEINGEQNEEVRRIRIERFAGSGTSANEGWLRYVKESGAKAVDRRLNERDGQWETLYEFADGRRRMVVADPSTGRQYALGVPRELKTTQDAQDWMSHGLDGLAIHRS